MNKVQVSVSSLGKWAQSAAQRGFAHLRETLANLQCQAAADDAAVDAVEGESLAEVKEHLSERCISAQLLRFSVFVLAVKSLHNFFDRQWLLSVDSGISSVLAASLWLWSILLSSTSAFVPLTCGVAMAVITWYMVFLDTCIPGVYPPSTALTKKRWIPLPSSFHLGCAIALINGLILSILMYQGYSNPSKM